MSGSERNEKRTSTDIEKSEKGEVTGPNPVVDYEESSGRSVSDPNVHVTSAPDYGQYNHTRIDAHVSTSHHDSSVAYPHPEIVAGYERLLPGATDRILTMAEKEQDARINFFNTQEANQHKAVMKALTNETLGVILGFVAITGLGIGGAFAIDSGSTELGVVLLSLSGAGYIGTAVSAVRDRLKGRGSGSAQSDDSAQ